MNYRVVLNLLGKILLIEAAFMALPILVALLYGESSWIYFLIPMLGAGLIGACVLLTAPAAAFGQKPTAAKQPVAADSAAAQPAEKQPAARIVVFRDSLVLIHCDTPPLFREGDIRTFREWVNEQVRNVRIVIGCPPFPPRVVVSFVIGTTGRLTGIRVLQSPDSKLSAEAVRALESSPHWKPGELYGRKVPVEITIPVDFRSSN